MCKASTISNVRDLHGVLTLTWVTIGVDRGGRKALVVKVVVKKVNGRLRVAEDERASGLHGEEKVVDGLTSLVAVDLDDLLANVLVSLTSTTDLDANIVFSHVLASDLASTLWKGGREHHVNMIGILVGVCDNVSGMERSFDEGQTYHHQP